MIRKVEIQKVTKYENPSCQLFCKLLISLVKSFDSFAVKIKYNVPKSYIIFSFSLADYADFADNFSKNLPNL